MRKSHNLPRIPMGCCISPHNCSEHITSLKCSIPLVSPLPLGLCSSSYTGRSSSAIGDLLTSYGYRPLLKKWDVHARRNEEITLLASCGSDGVLVIYNVPAFSVHTSFSEHEGGVITFAWSPDDTRMVTCGRDNRALLWNTAVS